MPFIQADSVFKEFRDDGYWGTPAQEPSSAFVPGSISYDAIHHGKLKLFGNYSAGARISIIWGILCNGEAITIFDAVVINQCGEYGKTPIISELSFLRFWRGQHYQSPADISLMEFKFGISHLEEWHDQKYFEYLPTEDRNEIILRYKRPPEIKLFENDKVEIRFQYFTARNSCIAQRESGLSHGARIVIKVKKDCLPFYNSEEQRGIEFYYEHMLALFVLLIGESVYSFDLHGLSHIEQTEIANAQSVSSTKPFPVFVHYVDSQYCGHCAPKTLVHWDLIFTYASVKEQLPELVTKWFAEEEKISYAIGDFVGFCNSAFPITRVTLAQLTFALEGLHGRIFETAQNSEKQLCLLRETVSAFGEKPEQKYIKLKERFYHSLRIYKAVLGDPSDKELYLLAQDIADFRNDISHCKQQETRITQSNFFFFSRFVNELLAAMLATLAGMSIEQITARFVEVYGFRETNNHIQKYMKKRSTESSDQNAK